MNNRHIPALSKKCPILTYATVPRLDLAGKPFDLNDPVAIGQHTLDCTGIALKTDDFDLFRAFFHLPYTVETFAEKAVIQTVEDLRGIYDRSRANNEDSGVTERVRECISAEFISDTKMSMAFVTRLMHKTYQLREPVPAYSQTKVVNGVWLCTGSSYALEEKSDPYDRLLTRQAPTLPTDTA